MSRYTQEHRDRALGVLHASAVERDGVWEPLFKPSARTLADGDPPLKVDDRTLRRWWKRRDVSQDAAIRLAVTKSRSKVREGGAEEWTRSAYLRCRELVGATLEEVEGVYYEYTMDGSIKGPKFVADRKLRAIQLAMDVIPAIDDRLSGKGDGSRHPEGRVKSLKDAILRKRSLTGRSKT